MVGFTFRKVSRSAGANRGPRSIFFYSMCAAATRPRRLGHISSCDGDEFVDSEADKAEEDEQDYDDDGDGVVFLDHLDGEALPFEEGAGREAAGMKRGARLEDWNAKVLSCLEGAAETVFRPAVFAWLSWVAGMRSPRADEQYELLGLASSATVRSDTIGIRDRGTQRSTREG